MAQDSFVSENVKRAMKYNCAVTHCLRSVRKALKDDMRTKIDSIEADKLLLLRTRRTSMTQRADNSVEGEKGFQGGLTALLHFPESKIARKNLFPQLKNNAITSKNTEQLEELNLGLGFKGRWATKDREELELGRARSEDGLSHFHSFDPALEHRNNTASKPVGKTVKKLYSSSRHYSSLDDLRQARQMISGKLYVNEEQRVTKGLSRRHRKLSQSLPDIETVAVSASNEAGYTIDDDSIAIGKPAETVFSSGCQSRTIASRQDGATSESLSPCHNHLLYRRRKISKSLSSIARGALDTIHNMELQAFERMMNSREGPAKTTNGRLRGGDEAGRPRALTDPNQGHLPSCECSPAKAAKSPNKPMSDCTPPPPRRREVCGCPHKSAPPLDANLNSLIFKRKQQSTQSLSQQMDNVKDLRYLRESKV